MNNSLTALEDYPIALERAPSTPWWSENYALMCADPGTRKALFFGTGRWHGDLSIWRELLLVNLTDGRVIFAKGYGRNGTQTGPGGSFSKLEIIEPGHKVRLTYDGPMWESSNKNLLSQGFRDGPTKRCVIDMVFESTFPMWNMQGDSVAATKVAGASHIDQMGNVNGMVQYDGVTYPFTDGYAVRDHSRGPREPSKYKRHCWTSGSFPGGRGFYVYAMGLQNGSAKDMSNASVVRDGKCYPAKLLSVEYCNDADDLYKPPTILLESEIGEMKIRVTEMLGGVVTGMISPYDTIVGTLADRNAAVILDASTRLEWDGKDGFGWLERGYVTGPL